MVYMTKTQENLLKAFAGESQARNKYTVFAKMARKQNLEWVARVFEETADQERAHAEEEFELIREKATTTDTLGIEPFSADTVANLKMAAAGEHHEWTEMYPSFEEQAKADGDLEAERLFREVKEVEEKHEERYIILAKHIEAGTLYKQDREFEWKCLNCGYIHKGTTPPTTCPVCKKPFTWYMALGLIR
jgi:rubrerythrin